MANLYNAGMCQSGNRTEVAQMVEHSSSIGKASGSILARLHFRIVGLKNYSAITAVSL